MKELISPEQAQRLMIVVLIAAPAIGLVWGIAIKRIVPVLLAGVAIGAGNFILWTLYNTITDSLGLDTVKNLLVNLSLFVILGAVIGGAIGYARRRPDEGVSKGGPGTAGGGGSPMPALVGGGPQGEAGAARTREEAEEPPRDMG